MLKKYFFTGLAVLLPLAITCIIVQFIVRVLTDPFIDFVDPIIRKIEISQSFLYFPPDTLNKVFSQIAILVLLLSGITLVGAFTRWLLVRVLVRIADFFFSRVPFVKTIYGTSKDLIKLLVGSQSNAFRHVVLVPFPRPGMYSFGFVTQQKTHPVSNILKDEMIAVLVPTTPNPTSGFLGLFKKEEVIFTEMPIQEGIKIILSCGVLQPDIVGRRDLPEEFQNKGD